jgi:hypothetical protein
MAGLAVPSTYRSGDIHGRQREILTGTHPQPTHPCEDLLYIQLQGRAPRAGPGWSPFMRKRRAMAALTVERRSNCP